MNKVYSSEIFTRANSIVKGAMSANKRHEYIPDF